MKEAKAAGKLTLYDLGQITYIDKNTDGLIRIKGTIGNEPIDAWLGLGQSVDVRSITVHIS